LTPADLGLTPVDPGLTTVDPGLTRPLLIHSKPKVNSGFFLYEKFRYYGSGRILLLYITGNVKTTFFPRVRNETCLQL
jgi:hypothetical protein